MARLCPIGGRDLRGINIPLINIRGSLKKLRAIITLPTFSVGMEEKRIPREENVIAERAIPVKSMKPFVI